MRKKISVLRPLVIAVSVVALAAPAPALATGESAEQETKSEEKSPPLEQKPEEKDSSKTSMHQVEKPKADTTGAAATPAADPRCLFRDEPQPQASFNTLEDLYGQLLAAIEQQHAERLEQPQPAAPQIVWREFDPEE